MRKNMWIVTGANPGFGVSVNPTCATRVRTFGAHLAEPMAVVGLANADVAPTLGSGFCPPD